MKRLAGKTAIVTGASRGIGAEIARQLAVEGAQLILVARDTVSGQALVDEIGHQQAVFVAGDVTEPTTAETAVKEALSRFERLDVLVNNAGVDFTGELLEVGVDEVRQVFETNFFAAFQMLQAAARAMTDGGSIVNITSRLASIGVPTMTVYGASKGAVLSLTRGAAVDLAPRGIRVNAIAPGLTETDLLRTWIGAQPDAAEFEQQLLATIPQRRFGKPSDVASAVAFLASDDAGHITGASLAVDGGYTAT
jgi:NAD(P)-dependent dehydrogenase (short-subunit alcohol dehydrogenase family)